MPTLLHHLLHCNPCRIAICLVYIALHFLKVYPLIVKSCMCMCLYLTSNWTAAAAFMWPFIIFHVTEVLKKYTLLCSVVFTLQHTIRVHSAAYSKCSLYGLCACAIHQLWTYEIELPFKTATQDLMIHSSYNMQLRAFNYCLDIDVVSSLFIECWTTPKQNMRLWPLTCQILR